VTHLRTHLVALIAVVLIAGLQACHQGKRPFVIGVVCLKGERDFSDFKSELSLIADSESTTLGDRSAETQQELATIGHPFDAPRTRPAVNMWISLKDGAGLGVSNLGMPGYQVVFGINDGWGSAEAAHRFADTVVTRLKKRWRVELVADPAEAGAQPMKDCN
jgi:hypothetical protein